VDKVGREKDWGLCWFGGIGPTEDLFGKMRGRRGEKDVCKQVHGGEGGVVRNHGDSG